MCSQELAATKGLCFGDDGYAAIAASRFHTLSDCFMLRQSFATSDK